MHFKVTRQTIYAALVGATMLGHAFAGGLPGDGDLQRELARTQNELEDQKRRAEDLERQVDDLNSRVSDMAMREPRVVERPASSSMFDTEDWPVHGYFSGIYADPDLVGYEGAFDQETVNFFFRYPLDERFLFYADIGFAHGADVSVDLGQVEGTGDLTVVEAWLEWKALEDGLLSFRFGKYYTPFGQWAPTEIDPTTVSVFDPLLVRWSIAPLTSTGIQEVGTVRLGGIELSHTFYIGNGKTFRPHSGDENSNKAVGTRIGVRIPLGDGEESGIGFGMSGYMGRDDRDGFDYQENIYGFDGRVDFGPFTLRGETVKSRVNADDGLGNDAHVWSFAWFTQASYRFLERFEAFYRYDSGDDDFRFEDSGDIRINSYGLAFRPIEPVVFKTEFDRYSVDDETLGDYDVISGQVAVLF
jgi:hypothetical protein